MPPCPPHFFKARLEQHEVAFGTSTALGYGLADIRSHEAASLKPVKGRVNGTRRDLTPGRAGDFLADGRAVRTFAGAHEAQKDDQFEFTEDESWSHMSYSIANMTTEPRIGWPQSQALA